MIEAVRGNKGITALLVVGALATIGGLIVTWVARPVDTIVVISKGPIPTLPVNTYTQYTQAGTSMPVIPVADYSGMWIGIVIGVIGVALLLTGVVLAARRARSAHGA
ncbi:hypothetical protein [Leifsonia sp. NCR5]|uniref:hypothetical protein n=1 Tax=Leifsonia sp. NCR5 TaxID=1978342 RepID=UPI000A195BA0|nr:hypothetical protein [Leifsonia sp. NCR5]